MLDIALENPVQMVEHVQDALLSSLRDVFETMFQKDAAFISWEEVVEEIHVSSIMGFGGKMTGFLSLHFSTPAACSLTSGLLGAPIRQIDETVRDTVAELVNMVAGGLRNRLCSSREVFQLSLPSVVEGSAYTTHSPAGSLQLLLGVQAGNVRFRIQMALDRKRS